MSHSKLGNISRNVALHTSVSTLPGSGGASIAAWEDPDAAGFFPRHAVLLFTNVGAAAITIGDETDGAAVLLCGGVVAGPLFEERQVTIGVGESVWCPAPIDAAALGTTWAVRAPLSGASVALSVTARPIDVMSDAPSAAEVAAAVAAPSAAAIAAAVAAPSAATIATAVWSTVVEGAHTARDYMRVAVAVLAGRHAARTGVFYSPVSTSEARVTSTVSADGGRGNPTIAGGT